MILGIFYMVIKFERWSQILFGYIPSLSWFYHPIFIYSIEVQARLRSYTLAHTTHTHKLERQLQAKHVHKYIALNTCMSDFGG